MAETAIARLLRRAHEAEAAGQKHTAAAMRNNASTEDEAASFLRMMVMVGQAARRIRDRG